jgi:hypothetical protein
MRMEDMRLRTRAILALTWTLFVLYPNPVLLVESVERLRNPPLEYPPDVPSLPSSPKEIEGFVEGYVEYNYDFRVYGVPWYIPRPSEVVENKEGDCKSRAILLASILKEKGIPFSLEISPIHFWVDYPGKERTEVENSSVAIYSDGEWKLPEVVNWNMYLKVWKGVLWDSMPALRKLALIGGLIVIFIDIGELKRRGRGWQGYPTPLPAQRRAGRGNSPYSEGCSGGCLEGRPGLHCSNPPGPWGMEASSPGQPPPGG